MSINALAVFSITFSKPDWAQDKLQAATALVLAAGYSAEEVTASVQVTQ